MAEPAEALVSNVSPRPEEPRSGVSKDGNRRAFAHPSRRAFGAPQDEVSDCKILKRASPPAAPGKIAARRYLPKAEIDVLLPAQSD
jgi:hypothetical protein